MIAALSSAFSSENTAFVGSFSSPDSDLSVPRQITTGTTYMQSNARRTQSTHTRPMLEVVKAGKALNVSVVYSVQRKSVIINTSVVEHAHKLVYLGKLII
ncbi:MAG: hypothetical protein IJZ70_11175 [Bacteroidales bacterium]|nr:hypothetical protein [Bacteroidales bacterium]